MNVLYIDGEYLKKVLPDTKLIVELINESFGKIFYPDRIIYYSANTRGKERENLLAIKNMEINNKGFLHTKSNKTREQKGVDGYIVSDMTDASSNPKIKEISLIAGDGDLKAGLEKIFERKKTKVRLIAAKGSVSRELTQLSKVFYIDDFLDLNSNTKSDFLNDVDKFSKVYSFLEEKYGTVTDSLIGKHAMEYKFFYKENYGKLKKFLKLLVKEKIIEKEIIEGTPHNKIIFL